MKIVGFLAAMILFPLAVGAQGFPWTFYSENGEVFTLYIDGDKINDTPAQRVTAPGIKGYIKTVRIEFQDTRIPKVTKRMPLKPGLDQMTTVIKQNDKGEYILRVVDSTEGNGGGTVAVASPAQTSANGASGGSGSAAQSQTAPASSGPLTAKFASDVITLSDGRTFKTKRTKLFGAGAGVEMIAPEGASVKVMQDDGKETYTNEVPFDYSVKDFMNYDKYFKLEVNEGGKAWSVKIKNNNGFKIVIEQGESGDVVSAAAEPPPTPSSAAAGGQSAASAGQSSATAGQSSAGMGQSSATQGMAAGAYGQPQAASGGAASWVIYSEMGEKFIIFLDGQQINASPAERVMAADLTGQNKQVRVEFEDKTIPKILKRFPVVTGGETTIVIKKNKKGEYVINAVSAPKATWQAPADEPAGTAPESTSSGPLTAKVTDEEIVLSDGRRLAIIRKAIPGGWPGAEVEMLAPEGASVKITQDDGKEVYTSEVPFVYKVKDYIYFDKFFKMEVTEGGKTWSVKLKNGKSQRIKIE